MGVNQKQVRRTQLNLLHVSLIKKDNSLQLECNENKKVYVFFRSMNYQSQAT